MAFAIDLSEKLIHQPRREIASYVLARNLIIKSPNVLANGNASNMRLHNQQAGSQDRAFLIDTSHLQIVVVTDPRLTHHVLRSPAVDKWDFIEDPIDAVSSSSSPKLSCSTVTPTTFFTV